MKEVELSELKKAYTTLYPRSRGELVIASVPLRIAPLGAHSDHQGGCVTGLAIDRFVYLVGERLTEPTIHIHSEAFGDSGEIYFQDVEPLRAVDWRNYIKGCIAVTQTAWGKLQYGFRGVLLGRMPIGGLSSSAAVVLSYLSVLAHCNGRSVSRAELIELARRVENDYLGLKNGIMDQSVIVNAKRDALTWIDCSMNSVRSIPQRVQTTGWEIMIVYSGLSRQLTATPFNKRVIECCDAAREIYQRLGRPVPDAPRLGDFSVDEYESLRMKLSVVAQKRADHFFSEFKRVARGIEAWEFGSIEEFGMLVTQSGHSSIVNFESGSPALISLYEILSNTEGVLGTRFCGGGFQGCCFALIKSGYREAIAETLRRDYVKKHPELLNEYSLHYCQSVDSLSVRVM